MIKAAVFDFDGTIYSNKIKDIPEDTKEALRALRRAGIKCILATGRHEVEMDYFRRCEKELRMDAYVLLNGQIVTDSEWRTISDYPLSDIERRSLAELFNKKEVSLVLWEKACMYSNGVDKNFEELMESIDSAIPYPGEYTGAKLYGAMAWAGERREAMLKEKLPWANITRWNERSVDIIPQGSSKIKGIADACKSFGITPEEIVAFGDGENDIQMLKYAGIGVAMGNAIPETKAAADMVTSNMEQGGIYEALKSLNILS